ncbi:hypothetical protein [Ochrobactrum soli]|uniref:hypothetical protein n=1 Tax=Ochrobactrum soli TaxID=2448455 RepID=UPI001F308624|nr:hypothetical protein [[Ochrobactrum] soli]
MTIYAEFDADGFATAFYDMDFHTYELPSGAQEITREQWQELLDNPFSRKWQNNQIVEYNPPTIEPVTIIPAVTLWERMTDVEAEQVNAAMATQPFRTRQIFLTANTFRSDHELWPLLVQMATDLFGEERAAELLAAA